MKSLTSASSLGGLLECVSEPEQLQLAAGRPGEAHGVLSTEAIVRFALPPITDQAVLSLRWMASMQQDARAV